MYYTSGGKIYLPTSGPKCKMEAFPDLPPTSGTYSHISPILRVQRIPKACTVKFPGSQISHIPQVGGSWARVLLPRWA